MDLPLPLLQPTSKHTIWDNPVPIVTNRRQSDIYITDAIEEPSYYNELCHMLRQADKGDVINLHLNTPGGVIDSAVMIIDAIKKSKAKVTGYLTGTVASAGTIIALACDDLVVAPHTAFMIHNYSASGGHGKGAELKARQDFITRSLTAAFNDFYAGFLTAEEIEDVIQDRDKWMDKDEVDQRWREKTSIRRSKGKLSTDSE